jgi:hypothetical protein
MCWQRRAHADTAPFAKFADPVSRMRYLLLIRHLERHYNWKFQGM